MQLWLKHLQYHSAYLKALRWILYYRGTRPHLPNMHLVGCFLNFFLRASKAIKVFLTSYYVIISSYSNLWGNPEEWGKKWSNWRTWQADTAWAERWSPEIVFMPRTEDHSLGVQLIKTWTAEKAATPCIKKQLTLEYLQNTPGTGLWLGNNVSYPVL